MKLQIVLAVFCSSVLCIAQSKKSTKMGKTTLEELNMSTYEKDTTARAVVLYEHGNYYVNTKRAFKFTTDFYFRVKILKKQGFDKATITIPFYNKEEVHDVKAVTSNVSKDDDVEKISLLQDAIYTKDVSGKWKEVSFTLPNVKVGSVIEYRYSVTSPYMQIDDWEYQSDIPKLKSDFTAAILGNYEYNIRLVGNLKLARDNYYVKNGCVYVPGIGTGSCGVLEYGIEGIPAFKEEEYMLSKDNFLSRLSFESKSSTNAKGQVTNYTKTWEVVDKSLKSWFLSSQNLKKNYAKKYLLTDQIMAMDSDIDKAKNVYAAVQSYYTWNQKYWTSRKVELKKAIQNKLGSVFEINLSLFYALQAAGIEANLVLLSTRDRAIPTKLYPVVSDFNYMVVRAVIHDQVYFLDAVNQYGAFGLIQFESLNGEGRVLDFKNGSFWEQIILRQKSSNRTMLSLSLEDESFVGELTVKRTGYPAINKRAELDGRSEDAIAEDLEDRYPDLEVKNVELENLNDTSKALTENYTLQIETNVLGSSKIRFSPFLIGKITKNPFKLESRDYPVNFGYERSNTSLIKIEIPEEYKVSKLPKNMAIAIPNKGGKIIFNANQKGNAVIIYLKYTLNKKKYTSDEYFYLKKFYENLINAQDSFIEIEKI